MDVSVIIPTHNRPDQLTKCINKIKKQTAEIQYEIIIFDDNSENSQNIKQIVNQSNADYIKLLQSNKNVGPAKARNVAADYASGELLLFTDDDTEPTRNWIKNMYRSYKNGSNIIEGKVIPGSNDNHIFDNVIKNIKGGSFLTANMAYKRSIFMELNGFHEGFKSAFREDSDLAFKAIKRGYKLEFESSAVVKHPVNKKSLRTIMTETTCFQYDLLLYKRHPKLYKKHISLPIQRYTPVYVTVGTLSLVHPILLFTIPLISIFELRTYNLEGKVFDFVTYGYARLIASFVLIMSVINGIFKYQVNPLSFFQIRE